MISEALFQPKSDSHEDPESLSHSWAELVARIQGGDQEALEELYRVFSRGIRFYLCRQLGSQDLDDKVHDVFLIITQAIQKGELRQPERLMGYVRTIVRRQVAIHIDAAVQARRNQASLEVGSVVRDRQPDPERIAIERQSLELAMRILNSIPERDREVLVRFYLREQSQEQICQELKLSSTQFRLIKSRAKARFGKLGRASLTQRLGFFRKRGA
ncbi:MAG: RNA polymerase sigma factor [Bryobacteraceae bacterium]